VLRRGAGVVRAIPKSIERILEDLEEFVQGTEIGVPGGRLQSLLHPVIPGNDRGIVSEQVGSHLGGGLGLTGKSLPPA
jgi:hypothetical protein